MRIVEPYAKILGPNEVTDDFTPHDGVAMLRRIEYFGRVSHASEDAITDDSYDRFIRSVVLVHGDFSIIEHEKVSVEALVDRGITHEWVRHRIGSYTQESTRFINYKKKGGEAKFICPMEFSTATTEDELTYSAWHTAMEQSENSYMQMLRSGVAPQLARSVFPNSLASKLIVTYNLRSWRHFFIMRTSAEAHPQMKQVTIPLLMEFKAKIPILFEDLEPNSRQALAMKNLR